MFKYSKKYLLFSSYIIHYRQRKDLLVDLPICELQNSYIMLALSQLTIFRLMVWLNLVLSYF